MKCNSVHRIVLGGALLTLAACDQTTTEAEETNLEQQPQLEQPVQEPMQPAEPGAAAEGQQRAEADIEAAEGKEIGGEAEFTETPEGVKIVVNVEEGPSGKKGVHIHEKGDCSNIDGESMGSHFAPEGDKHALPTESQDQRHLGDLGNIEIGEDGKGRLEITVPKANLSEGDKMSFLGKAVVIHEGQDQGATKQPSGGSGTPIACGVIEKT